MATVTFDDEQNLWRRDVTVVAGVVQHIFIPSRGPKLGMVGRPGQGGSIKIEMTLSTAAEITAGTAHWATWVAAAAAAPATERFDMPITAVRLTALVADAAVSLVQ